MTLKPLPDDRPTHGADGPERRARRIVVGVNGSPNSRRALAWAIEEARRIGATVAAVHAWTMGPYRQSVYTTSRLNPDLWRRCARALLDRACGEVDATGVDVQRVLRQGASAAVLLDEARGADLVVVGARDRAGVSGLLVGSVSDRVAHRAPCPVVVVRDELAA